MLEFLWDREDLWLIIFSSYCRTIISRLKSDLMISCLLHDMSVFSKLSPFYSHKLTQKIIFDITTVRFTMDAECIRCNIQKRWWSFKDVTVIVRKIGKIGRTINSIAQHSTAQHSIEHNSIAQYIKAQRSIAQHSTAQNRTEQHFALKPLKRKVVFLS